MATHVIRGGRGTGRTTLLLLHACRTQTPILVKDRIRADCIRKHASMLGIFNLLPPIYTVQDLKLSYGFYGKHVERVAIDDVDDVLNTMLGGVDISMVTYTSHEDDKDLGFESLWLKNNPNLPKEDKNVSANLSKNQD